MVRATIHLCRKAIACLAIAFALVVFPASAPHAMAHQGVAAAATPVAHDMHQMHDTVAKGGQHHEAANAAHDCGAHAMGADHDMHDASGCCSGICAPFSVTVPSNVVLDGIAVSVAQFQLPVAPPVSFDASGHLRPPKT